MTNYIHFTNHDGLLSLLAPWRYTRFPKRRLAISSRTCRVIPTDLTTSEIGILLMCYSCLKPLKVIIWLKDNQQLNEEIKNAKSDTSNARSNYVWSMICREFWQCYFSNNHEIPTLSILLLLLFHTSISCYLISVFYIQVDFETLIFDESTWCMMSRDNECGDTLAINYRTRQ